MADLVMQESAHLHALDGVSLTQTHNLTVATCKHTVRNSLCTPAEPQPIRTPAGGALLPVPTLSTSSGVRINCPPMGLLLPALSLSVRIGARLSKRLPVPALSASAHCDYAISGGGWLPSLQGEGRTGLRAAAVLRLPAMQINASGRGDQSAWVQGLLPGLTVRGSISRRQAGDLSKMLPALAISAGATRGEWAMLDARLPAIKLSAAGDEQVTGTLTGTLPALETTTDTRATAGSMNLSADLPTLVMIPVGTGGADGNAAVLTEQDRFCGYEMRYQR